MSGRAHTRGILSKLQLTKSQVLHPGHLYGTHNIIILLNNYITGLYIKFVWKAQVLQAVWNRFGHMPVLNPR